MLDFRKVLLALSVAGLGFVGTASAQIPQLNTYGVTPFEGYVAVEGIAELLPGLQIGITNGNQLAGSISFTLTSSVPFNNVITSGLADVTVTDTNLNNVAGHLDTFTVTEPGPNTAIVTVKFAQAPSGPAQWNVVVAGLRVNPSGVIAGTQVTVSVASASLVPSNTLASSTANVAFVANSLSSVKATNSTINVPFCAITSKTNYLVLTAVITNGFADSFKTIAEVTSGPAGAGYPANGNGTVATTGTGLSVTFNNLNTGVSYYVPSVISDTTTPSALSLTAYTSLSPLIQAPIATNNGTNIVLAADVLLPASGTIYYITTADAASGTEVVSIPLYELSPTGAVAPFATSAPSVTVTLAGPTSASPATGYPEYSTTQTAYTGTQAAVPAPTGYIQPCNTTLLFPFLATLPTIGYDTGIAIANAGMGTSTLIGNLFTPAATGVCSFTLYGASTINGTAITPNITFSATIANGQVYASTLGNFLGALATPQTSFAGYGVASCNYTGAHAFAQISDYSGLSNAFSEGYLAPVLSDVWNGSIVPGYTTPNSPF
jgi:hypothetical protein